MQFAFECNVAAVAVAADYILHKHYSQDLLDARRAAAAVQIQRTSFPLEPSNDYTGFGFVAADRILHIYHYLDPLGHTRYQTYYSVGDKEMRLRSQELIV